MSSFALPYGIYLDNKLPRGCDAVFVCVCDGEINRSPDLKVLQQHE